MRKKICSDAATSMNKIFKFTENFRLIIWLSLWDEESTIGRYITSKDYGRPHLLEQLSKQIQRNLLQLQWSEDPDLAWKAGFKISHLLPPHTEHHMAVLYFFGESLSDGEEKYTWIVKKKSYPANKTKSAK